MPAIVILLLFTPYLLIAQKVNTTSVPVGANTPAPASYAELYPNMSAKSIMTPTGFGSSGTYVFGFVGGTFPQPYRSKPDFVAAAGFGAGNSYKTISVTGILNINDVSKFDNYSASFIIARHLGKGSSISAGGLHLLADKNKTDGIPSYFLVFSHAAQNLPSFTPGYSKLSYSFGIGSGRFFDKSPKDISEGKGKKGTAVFANLSYELFKNFNVNAEWTGLNLGIGIGWRPKFKLPAIAIGLADLTGNSGNKPRFVVGIGHAFVLSQ